MVLMSWDAPQLGDSLHSSTVTAHAKILLSQTCSSAVQTPLSVHQLKAGAMECPIVQMDHEAGCGAGTTGLTIEATIGYTASIEVPSLHSEVFYDRQYTFDSLGSLAGHSFIKMSNDDKHIGHFKVQMKLRLPQPLTVYAVKLDDHELPWLHTDGWTLTGLEGVSYHGVRSTRHTDWSGELQEDFFGPGQVWEKTYPAGTVELLGNDGGDGSYLMFVANPAHPPTPTTPTVTSSP